MGKWLGQVFFFFYWAAISRIMLKKGLMKVPLTNFGNLSAAGISTKLENNSLGKIGEYSKIDIRCWASSGLLKGFSDLMILPLWGIDNYHWSYELQIIKKFWKNELKKMGK